MHSAMNAVDRLMSDSAHVHDVIWFISALNHAKLRRGPPATALNVKPLQVGFCRNLAEQGHSFPFKIPTSIEARNNVLLLKSLNMHYTSVTSAIIFIPIDVLSYPLTSRMLDTWKHCVVHLKGTPDLRTPVGCPLMFITTVLSKAEDVKCIAVSQRSNDQTANRYG